MMAQERFGPYVLIDRVGQGGQSTVFRALDPQGRTVALKVLNKNLLNDEIQRQRFLMEPRQQPMHPNIVRILDVGGECPPDRAGDLSNGRSVPYFATEFIEGRSLLQMMRDLDGNPLRLSFRDLYPILRDIAAALDAVHQRGIVHRDIKPGNILLRAADRHAFLADFGIAKSAVTGNMTITTTSRPGSATYMAPEQADVRLGAMGVASDVYSLGVTAYEALVGRPPFVAPMDVAVMYKHINEAPADIAKIAPDVPPRIATVVMRALSKAPRERYASAGEFANQYFEALTASVTQPKPLPVGALPRPPQRWILPALIVAFLAVAAVVAGVALSGERPLEPGAPTPTSGTPLTPSRTPVIATATPAATASRATGATVTVDAQAPTARATSTLDPYAPAATSTLVPAAVGTERATAVPASATSVASGTPPPPPVILGLRLEAISRGGYEEWGKPPSSTRCDDVRNDRGRGFRFKAAVQLTNLGASTAAGLSAVFYDVNGRPVTACVEGYGPGVLPSLSAGQRIDLFIVAYLETKSIRKLLVNGPGNASSELCYDGEAPASCR